MIWTIGLVISGNNFWKKCVYVICEIWRKSPKITKTTKFLEDLEYQGIGKTFSVKCIKLCIISKAILSVFHCFLFHENILYISEVIALLVKAYHAYSESQKSVNFSSLIFLGGKLDKIDKNKKISKCCKSTCTSSFCFK